MYETALHVEAKRRIREIGSADVVVGIPTYRNGRTIARVMDAAVGGLARDFPNARAVIVNTDGGSSDNTTQITSDWPTPGNVSKIVTPYEGLLGRGSAVRAIFEIAAALGSRVCIVLSPEARDMTASWLSALAAPILADQCDIVLGDYHRLPLEGALADHLVYPMLRLLYGVGIRQAAGELAIRSDLAGQCALRDVWETDVARHGLDVWLTVLSLVEERRVGQVDLGTKFEGLRDFVVPLDPRFLQSVGTLFRLASIYRRTWMEQPTQPLLTTFGEPERGALANNSRGNVALDGIWEAALKGRHKFRGTWRAVLASDHLERIREAFKSGPSADAIPMDLWARAVIDFAVVYNKGEGDPDKVVCALLPIYYARVVSYMLEMQASTPAIYEKGIQDQAAAFEEQRPYLHQRWMTYVPWMGGESR